MNATELKELAAAKTSRRFFALGIYDKNGGGSDFLGAADTAADIRAAVIKNALDAFKLDPVRVYHHCEIRNPFGDKIADFDPLADIPAAIEAPRRRRSLDELAARIYGKTRHTPYTARYKTGYWRPVRAA